MKHKILFKYSAVVGLTVAFFLVGWTIFSFLNPNVYTYDFPPPPVCNYAIGEGHSLIQNHLETTGNLPSTEEGTTSFSEYRKIKLFPVSVKLSYEKLGETSCILYCRESEVTSRGLVLNNQDKRSSSKSFGIYGGRLVSEKDAIKVK